MSWTEEKVNLLKKLWGSGKTASQIAEIIGGISRNAVIGKAHRLNLSAKIKTRSSLSNNSNLEVKRSSSNNFKKGRKFKYHSLLLDKNFEPARNLNLEELTDETCKYMEGHPDEKNSSFCGRKTVQKFSYCPLHLLLIYQVKSKKDELTDEDEIPKFIEKKIKSA